MFLHGIVLHIGRFQGLLVQIQFFVMRGELLVMCHGFLLSKNIHGLQVSQAVGQDFHGLFELKELGHQILFGGSRVAGEDVVEALGVVSHYCDFKCKLRISMINYILL